METTASNLNALFDEIKKTIACLGENNFYRKICQLNGIEIPSVLKIDCQALSEQIFFFLSKSNYHDFCLKLKEFQNTTTKIPEEEYKKLLTFVALKFQIEQSDILEGRKRTDQVQHARQLFFYLLKNHYDVPVKQIRKTHYFVVSYINGCIRKHSELSPKIPLHQKLIEIRQETIQHLNTA